MCRREIRILCVAVSLGVIGLVVSDLVGAVVLPDLRVTRLQAPSKALPGQTISVSDVTKNAKAPAPASFTRFYLSLDQVLDGADVELGDRAVPPLGAGVTNSSVTSLTIPLDTAMGTHYLLAKADDADTVSELNEGNNLAQAVIGIGPGPDLSATMAVPYYACAGTSITIKDTTKSLGFDPAVASTTFRYLSQDNVLDGGDTVIGGRSVPGLNPGHRNSGSLTWDIPSSLPHGIYYIGVFADGPEAVAEINEANNGGWCKIVIKCGPEICGDGVDNDHDGQVDEDCVEVCGDGVDNDGDGQVDEGCAEICGDGVDNDGDGVVDEGCVEICADGVDNDGDGQVDEGCLVEICADGIDNDLDGQVDEGCPTPLNPGTGTPGYWKNHLEAWPVSTIVIGGVTYTKEVAADLMGHPDEEDKTYTMFQHLVAARLNILIGNDPSCVGGTIVQADAWLTTFALGSGVGGSSAAWGVGEPLKNVLDSYNNGHLCAPARK